MRRNRPKRSRGGVARAGRRRRGAGPVVLLYHRIGQAAIDPQLLSVTPEHFAEHLQAIDEEYRPTRLGDVLGDGHKRSAPPPTVVITFDDGYADNLLVAKPLLERTGIPATVFVASGCVRKDCRFWWDELERLLLQPGNLPSTFFLQIAFETLRFEVGDDAVYTPE